MKTKSRIALLFLGIILVSCSKINQKNFEKIDLGMTKNKVEEIFGQSEDGKYMHGSTEVTFEYDNNFVGFKTYITKRSSEECILVAMLEGIFGLADRNGRSEIVDYKIRDYKISVSSSTIYIDPENNNEPFSLKFSCLYKVFGKFKDLHSSLYKGEILVNRIEKVFSPEELHPKDASTFASRGNKKFHYDDFKGAIADFTKAIELKPNDTIFYQGRAISKFQLDDKTGAKIDLVKAVELGSVDAQDILNKYFK
jgi:tetratricopeptide (TPR) repeat protein